ncbi:MAG: hypothetical protein HGA71_08210 [Azonexaceae bacterium]|nr:hypothetical protein [Azonexaceae bacterium]
MNHSKTNIAISIFKLTAPYIFFIGLALSLCLSTDPLGLFFGLMMWLLGLFATLVTTCLLIVFVLRVQQDLLELKRLIKHWKEEGTDSNEIEYIRGSTTLTQNQDGAEK